MDIRNHYRYVVPTVAILLSAIVGITSAAPNPSTVRVSTTTLPLAAGDTAYITCAGQVVIVPYADHIVVGCNPTTTDPTATATPAETSAPSTPTTPASTSTPTTSASTPTTGGGGGGALLMSSSSIAAIPMSGSGWSALSSAASGSWGSPKLADLNSNHDQYTLAGALYYARTGDSAMRAKVASAILSAIGTESGSRSLEVSRNIVGYVLAADLIGFRSFKPADESRFRSWLAGLRTQSFDGRTIVDTHEERPNNWGTMAGAARVAIDRYLGDSADLARAWAVFQGWAGDRSAYAGFDYGDTSWQCDPAKPVGINPAGCSKSGHDIGGVLPDDQRRSGSFSWPPPCAGYVHEGLQGAIVQALLLQQGGYPAFATSNRAILRSYQWLYANGCPASGDDRPYPFIVNRFYGSSFPTDSGATIGKNFGWSSWLFAR